MKYLKKLIVGAGLTGNVLVALGFLLSAYSSYIPPVDHPVLACVGLAFPFFLAFTLAFLCYWAFVCPKMLVLPLLTLVAGWPSLQLYFPVGSGQKQHSSSAIKVLTYNTQAIADDGTVKGQNAVLAYLAGCKADIICLQEFNPGVHASEKQVYQALSEYPYHQLVRVDGGTGLACFSKFPILSAKRIEYKSKYNGSAVFFIRLDSSDTLAVFNNHLESNKLDGHDKEVYNELLKSPRQAHVRQDSKYLLHKLAEAAALRGPQADSVAKAIRQYHTRYMLVCGDFNDSPLSYAHRVIGQGLTDAYVQAGTGPGFTYNQNHFYFRIDHLFVSSSFRVLDCKVDRSIKASDHYPVWCLLERK